MSTMNPRTPFFTRPRCWTIKGLGNWFMAWSKRWVCSAGTGGRKKSKITNLKSRLVTGWLFRCNKNSPNRHGGICDPPFFWEGLAVQTQKGLKTSQEALVQLVCFQTRWIPATKTPKMINQSRRLGSMGPIQKWFDSCCLPFLLMKK